MIGIFLCLQVLVLHAMCRLLPQYAIPRLLDVEKKKIVPTEDPENSNCSEFKDHSYFFVRDRKTYADAKSICRKCGMTMVHVFDKVMDNWLINIVNAKYGDKWWIGLTDSVKEGTFVWDDGEELTYSNWYKTEPNDMGGEDCTEYGHYRNGQWNDISCRLKRKFICQKKVVNHCPPADGIWVNWKSWTRCTKSCGGGQRTRTRECIEPTNGGKKCEGKKKESEPCGEKECPADGKWKHWNSWTDCTKSCGGGQRTRTRECIEPTNGGKKCEGKKEEFEPCGENECAADGKWKHWNSWTDCTKSCGGGQRTRTRECIEPTNGGKKCEGKKKESEPCGEKECPADGKWKHWNSWTDCTKSCGGGQRTRTRECIEPTNGGKKCEGKKEEFEPCGENECAVWNNWGPLSECTETCGGGTQIRLRSCSGNDGDCPGDYKMETQCNMEKCPQGWTEWGSWDDCSRVCGGGSRRHARNCRGGGNCIGNAIEEGPCNTHKCPQDNNNNNHIYSMAEMKAESNKWALIVAVLVGCLLLIGIIAAIIIYRRKLNKNKMEP